MSAEYYQEMKVHEARLRLAASGANYLAARISFEIHPEDPYGDASVQFSGEVLDQDAKALHDELVILRGLNR